MVDWYGRWTYEPNMPEKKKCDCDRLAELVLKWCSEHNYKIKTTIENIVLMIYSYVDNPDMEEELERDYGVVPGWYITPEIVFEVAESSGIPEFDWEDR